MRGSSRPRTRSSDASRLFVVTRIPLPSPADSIDGLVTPSAALARGYVGWRVDGFLYQWEKAEGFEKWLAFWLAAQAMVQTFFLVFVFAVFFRSPRRRYYLSEGRDAVLGIGIRWGRWRVIDHAVANPGTGSGEALFGKLRPTLLQEADEQGITIEAYAPSQFLADRYDSLLPGMVVIRRNLFRGLLMRREPVRSAPRSSTT